MARRRMLPYWMVSEILKELEEQDLERKRQKANLKAELEWKLQRDLLDERSCFSCGQTFHRTAEGAVIERDEFGTLKIQLCPSCAYSASAELYAVTRERISEEFNSSSLDIIYH